MGNNNRRALLESVLPHFNITKDSITATLEHNQNKAISLEIGFGDGQHLLQKAMLAPDVLFIGCEVYLDGIAKLLDAILKNNINNILIYNGDARDLCHLLPDHLLSDIYVLFPDPWPKKKHHKRRLINIEFLYLLRSKAKNNGRIVIATDHLDYANWIGHELESNHIKYSKEKPDNWITTKYQKKSDDLGIKSNYFVIDIFHDIAHAV